MAYRIPLQDVSQFLYYCQDDEFELCITNVTAEDCRGQVEEEVVNGFHVYTSSSLENALIGTRQGQKIHLIIENAEYLLKDSFTQFPCSVTFGKELQNITELTLSSANANWTYKDFSLCFPDLKRINLINCSDAKSINGIVYNNEETQVICCPQKYTGSIAFPFTIKSFVQPSNYIRGRLSQKSPLESPNITTTNISETSISVVESYTFSRCKISHIELPSTVTLIKENAFYNSEILFVNIQGNPVLESKAFSTSMELKTVTIGNITNIPSMCFFNCPKLENFPFETITTIDSSAFVACNFREISLLNTADIGASAFAMCAALEHLYFGQVQSIGSNAFHSCTNITTVHIDEINDWASINFTNANSNPLSNGIAKLYISDKPVASPIITADEIKPYAFYNYKHLESLEFHGTTIADTALTGCTNLTSVTLKGQPTSLANVFKDLTGLQTVNTVPSSVTDLENAFNGCTALTAIHDWQVNTSLSSVNMTNCFAGCTNLTDIFVKFPQIATEQSKWHLVVFDITSTTPPYRCKIYASDLDSNGNFVVERDDIYFYPDITLFNEVDEFAGASAITDDELKVFLKAKYPLAYYRDRNVLDPTQKSFILWAKNKQSVSTNLFDVGISLSDSDFEEII